MSGTQIVSIIGRLAKDPEVKTFGERTVAKFSIPVDGYKDHTEWFNCEIWGKPAENLAKYKGKGDWLNVVGELETKEHNGKRYTTLKAREVNWIGPRQDAGNGPAQDSEIPF